MKGTFLPNVPLWDMWGPEQEGGVQNPILLRDARWASSHVLKTECCSLGRDSWCCCWRWISSLSVHSGVTAFQVMPLDLKTLNLRVSTPGETAQPDWISEKYHFKISELETPSNSAVGKSPAVHSLPSTQGWCWAESRVSPKYQQGWPKSTTIANIILYSI